MESRRALNGNLLTTGYIFRKYVTDCNDVLSAVSSKRSEIFEELGTQLQIMNGLKWYLAVKVRFSKIVNNEEVTATPTFHGKIRVLLPADNVEEQYLEALNKVLESMAKWVSEGSGWSLDCVERVDLSIVKYQPLRASSYIPTPKKIANSKQGVVNIKNERDEKCFLWSVLAAIHGPDEHRNYRVNKLRQHEGSVDMRGINYPVKITDLTKFENQNRTISINVFGYENEQVYPLRITKEKGRTRHINLLLLSDNRGNTHYCHIKVLGHLLYSLTKHTGASYYCNYCLHRFSSKDMIDEHTPMCSPHGAQKTLLPTEKDKWLKFTNYTLTHKVPYTIYADFESYLVPINTCLPNPNTSHTTPTAQHIPSGFCYVIVNDEGKAIKPPVTYTGTDVVDTFLDRVLTEAEELMPIIKTNVPVNMSAEDIRNFDTATDCHLCTKPLHDDKVRNHDHLTGKYLGAAHNACNLNYRVPKHIPVFFHNLKGYDCHHLMQGFGKHKERRMSCIAKTSERYMSVTLDSLRFLDSLQFLSSSLDTLVKNLTALGPSQFNVLRQCMGDTHLDLLLRKGVFPYTWLSDPKKLDETSLPPRNAFFNDLSQEHITDEDYAHAQTVWNTFGMTCMREYHDLYLKTDVLLLADVFESFRKISLQNYGIDPCNVYSSPGLAWNAMLKMTGVRLELLTDINQHLFIEEGIRGGVAMIPHRHATANNPYVPDYKTTDPNSYLMYLDCNNLYGTAMSQPLPQSDFRWMDQQEIDRLDVTAVPDDSQYGYILEVDLHYPDHLHNLHSDYPLAPERKEVKIAMLSPYNKAMCDRLNFKPCKVPKLLTTLEDKTKYILHYRNLKLYLRLGLVLTKVHRVLTFRQSTWLKPFIDFNTMKRAQGKNKAEKDFFKLMNNATYGKSLENVRSRTDFKLVADEQKLIKWTASPRLMDFYPFTEDLAGLHLKKRTIHLNRPVYVGLSVLDISKLVMYEFHYDWAMRKYGANIRLCMTDTDSLLYHITTPDVYDDMKQELHLFDTSEYPTDHPCYSEENKKQLGKFKDEMNGRPPIEFVGLRAKCYSILSEDRKEKRVAKGVPTVAIEKQLKHEKYKSCLFDWELKTTSALSIQSARHQLFTQKCSKLSLSPYDDKRFVMGDGICTLPYGHHSIANKKRKLDRGDGPPMKRSKPEGEGGVIPSTHSSHLPCQPSTSKQGSVLSSLLRQPHPSTSKQGSVLASLLTPQPPSSGNTDLDELVTLLSQE